MGRAIDLKIPFRAPVATSMKQDAITVSSTPGRAPAAATRLGILPLTTGRLEKPSTFNKRHACSFPFFVAYLAYDNKCL